MRPFYTRGNGSIREPSVAKTQCELRVRSKTTESAREKAYLLILLCCNGGNWSGHFCRRFSGVCGERTDTVRVKLEFGLWRGAKSLAEENNGKGPRGQLSITVVRQGNLHLLSCGNLSAFLQGNRRGINTAAEPPYPNNEAI